MEKDSSETFHLMKLDHNENLEIQINNKVNMLNTDCLEHIFDFLPIKDRVTIERVCKHWQSVSKDSWQNIKILNEDTIWGFDPCKKYNSSKITTIFHEILHRCSKRLTHIDFSYLDIKNNVLCHIGENCPNLQFLNTGSLNLTLPAIEILTANCHNIRDLTFSTCSNACNDYRLSRFVSANKKLRYLKMMDNHNLTGTFLLSLPRDSMETIIILDCPSISYAEVAKAVQNFKNLQILILFDINDFNYPRDEEQEPCSTVNRLSKKLTRLCISNFIKVNNTIIGTLVNLHHLDVSKSDISDIFLEILAENCKELVHINLNDCVKVTDVGIKAISRLPKLEDLLMKRLPHVTDQPLMYMPKLKKLLCAECIKIKDDGLCTLLSSCDTIAFIDCMDCYEITNALIYCAIKATSLRTNGVTLKLNVEGTSVEPEKILEKSPLLDLILPATTRDIPDYSDVDVDVLEVKYYCYRLGYHAYDYNYDDFFLYAQ